MDSLVQSGAAGAYEALQLYRSRALKLNAKDEFGAALSTCAGGATALLKFKYNSEGSELCNLLLDFVTEYVNHVQCLRAIYLFYSIFPIGCCIANP